MNGIEKANRELAKSEEYYRTLWNHAVDSELILDPAGIILDVNRRAELMLSRPVSDLIGTPAADLFPDQERPRFEALRRHVSETGKEGSVEAILVPTSAGGVLTMELDLVPIEQAGGIAAVLLQLSDITGRQQLERQLIRSERLASLSQFASMFAHDIRNPLAGIKKTLEWLAQRPELKKEPLGRWFDDLQLTTDLMLGMINDMLDVYQESYSGLPLVSSSFSPTALLHEAVHLFRSEAEAREVIFRMDVPEEATAVTGDRRRLLRVGINLLHNALKYSPAGGAITLSVRRAPAHVLPAELPLPGSETLLICVADQGPGIEPDELPHIFEMFFRKKDGHDLRIGRGLGLHFCRLVVEAHGGRIWAENRSGGGAQFSVALPLRSGHLCRSDS